MGKPFEGRYDIKDLPPIEFRDRALGGHKPEPGDQAELTRRVEQAQKLRLKMRRKRRNKPKPSERGGRKSAASDTGKRKK